MSKERTSETFNLNNFIVFDKDVTNSDFRKIPNDFHGEVIVKGNINFYLEEDDEYLEFPYRDDVSVRCTGKIYCKEILPVKSGRFIFAEEGIFIKGSVLLAGPQLFTGWDAQFLEA